MDVFYAKARTNPALFAQLVMKDEAKGRTIRLAEVHKKWHELITEHDRLILWAHPSLGKTTQLAARMLWAIGNNPQIRICVLSNTHDMAVRIVRLLAGYIEHSEEFKRVFPDLEPSTPWTESSLTIKRPFMAKEPTIQAAGVHASILGSRIDLLVIDDLLDWENCRTEALRDKVWSWMQTTILTRLTKDARIVVIGNAFHPCLTAESLVVTRTHIKPARDITMDDELLVAPGKWERPEAISPTHCEDEVFRIQLSGVPDDIRLTGNHRVPVWRLFGRTKQHVRLAPIDCGLLYARDLQKGDYLVLDRTTPLEISDMLQFEPEVKSRASVGASMYGVRPFTSRSELDRLLRSKVKYKDIGKKFGIGISTVNRLVIAYGLEPGLGNRVEVPRGFSLTEEWWKIAGYWLAEGSIHSTKRGAVFVFGKTLEEKEFAEDVVQCAAKLGFRAYIRKERGCYKVQLQSDQAAKWLIAAFGEKARRKNLAWWVERAPHYLLKAMILCYWRGDGSALSSGQARFTTTSVTLAYALQRALCNLGINSSVIRGVTSGKGFSRERLEIFEVRISLEGAEILTIPTKTPTRRGKSRHPRIILEDKILVPIQEVVREHYAGTVYDFKTSTGWFQVPNVRIHNSDCLHRLAQLPAWTAYRYPVLDDQGQSRWPEAFPLERIESIKANMSPLVFAQQYLCVTHDDSAARFKREWFDVCERRGHDKTMVSQITNIPPGVKIITGVDLAVSKKESADLTVLFTIAVWPNGDREVLNIQSGRWAGPDIVARIVDTHKRFGSFVVVEDVASQAYLVQYTAQHGIPVRGFTTTAIKNHPELGIESIANELAMGKWIIPSMGGLHKEVQSWKDEMLFYDPSTHTGDRLMASWFCIKGIEMTEVKRARTMHIDLSSR